MLRGMMEDELASKINALSHERTDVRRAYRNGYFKRTIKLDDLGHIRDIRIPRTRNADIKLDSIKIYKKNYRDLNLEIIRTYYVGLKGSRLMEKLQECFGAHLSKEILKKAYERLIHNIRKYRNPRINMPIKYLILDGVWLLDKSNPSHDLRPLFVALGIDQEMRKTVLSLELVQNETAIHWQEFLQKLFKRGLRTKNLEAIVYGSIFELGDVLRDAFPNVLLQRCLNSKLSRVLDHRNFKVLGHREDLRGELQSAFHQSSKIDAKSKLEKIILRWKQEEPRSAQMVAEDLPELLNYFSVPSDDREKIRTSRLAQPVIKEVGEKTDMVAIFKNIGSERSDYF